MLCIPKIDNYLKILTDDQVKDFVEKLEKLEKSRKSC